MKSRDLIPDPDLRDSPRENQIRLARVTRVDYENYVMSIEWLDGGGGYSRVPITQPGRSIRASIVFMPEVGSLVVCGFVPHSNQKKKPIPLTYMPASTLAGLTHDPIILDRVPERVLERSRLRKVYPGEIYFGSTQGSDLFLDENVHLQNSLLNEFSLRASDQTALLNALRGYSKLSGVEVRSGIVARSRVFKKSDGTLDSDKERGLSPSVILQDGRVYRPVQVKGQLKDLNGNSVTPGDTSYYTELRIKVQDIDNGSLGVNHELTGVSVDEVDDTDTGEIQSPIMRDAVVDIALGNLIGDDFSDEESGSYARHLRFQIFSNDNDVDGIPKLSVLNETGDPDRSEPQEAGTAVYLRVQRAGQASTTFAVDKTGQTYLHIGGRNRSLDIRTLRGTKWVQGSNGVNGLSFDCFAEGAWNLRLNGKGTKTGLALNLNTIGGINMDLGRDQGGFSWNLHTKGSVQQVIDGDLYVECKGRYTIVSTGVFEHKILGQFTNNVVGDQNQVFGGNLGELIVGKRSTQIARGEYKTIAAPDIISGEIAAQTLRILSGNRTIEMLLGSQKTTVALGTIDDNIVLGKRTTTVGVGGIEQTVAAGNVKTQILAGNWDTQTLVGNVSLKTLAGNAELSTLLGNITLSTLAGLVQLSGTLGVNIQSAAQISLQAPQIILGTAPLGAVVVGLPTGTPHLDYVTGLPMRGVLTVLAGP